MRTGTCWHCRVRMVVQKVVLYVTDPYRRLISRDLCLNCISELEKEIKQKDKENKTP